MVYCTRRIALLSLLTGTAAAFTTRASAAAPMAATMYKQPGCACCDRYARYLGPRGFAIQVINTDHLARVQREHDVPPGLAGCHTMLLDGYVVDGLVPVSIIQRLLRERPAVTGITLPGMPLGAPGMDEPGMTKQAPFIVYAFGRGEPFVYARV